MPASSKCHGASDAPVWSLSSGLRASAVDGFGDGEVAVWVRDPRLAAHVGDLFEGVAELKRLVTTGDQRHVCRHVLGLDDPVRGPSPRLRDEHLREVSPSRSEEHTSELQSLMRISY